jgi:type IV pilus assembly protein PilC
MKYDEFAFFNQQLAAMLRDGIPLEGALHQLCANMRGGRLRSELELLETDLKSGTPLTTALAARKLPVFYVQMLQIGARGNDLPGMLQLLADYYQRAASIWLRLTGLMVYPLLVLIAAFALSCFLSTVFARLVNSNVSELMGVRISPGLLVNLWAPPVFIGLILAVVLAGMLIPACGRNLRWRIPAFKEAKLSQVASAMWLMLKMGGNLPDALALVQQLEKGTPASRELAQWQSAIAAGRGTFSEMATPGKAFPPLFLWLIGNSGEDLVGGFQRAAEIYGSRANYRIDAFISAALPLSILALGVMIVCQLFPLIRTFTTFMNGISG